MVERVATVPIWGGWVHLEEGCARYFHSLPHTA